MHDHGGVRASRRLSGRAAVDVVGALTRVSTHYQNVYRTSVVVSDRAIGAITNEELIRVDLVNRRLQVMPGHSAKGSDEQYRR